MQVLVSTRSRTWLALPDLLIWAGAGLVAAAGLEFLLLRIFTRTAIHIPGIQELRTPYLVLAETGRIGYFSATVLLALLLVGLVPLIARSRTSVAWVAALGIATYGIVAAMAAAGSADGTSLAFISLVAVILTAPWAVRSLPARGVLPVALYASAFTLAAVFAIGQATTDPILTDSALLVAAEALALGFAALSPLLVQRRDRFALGVSVGVGLVTVAALIGNESTSKVLALWSVGLAGSFPAVFYGVAAGGAAYATLASWRAGRQVFAIGLILLLMAGIGLHSTYQTGLAVTGLALLGAAASRADPISIGRSMASRGSNLDPNLGGPLR